MGGFFNGLKNALSSFDQYSPAAQRKGQLDIEKQQEQRIQQQRFDEELAHGLSIGGKYIGPGGMVQETTLGPDGQPTTIHRQADPNRYAAKYKNPATGETVQLEIPNEQEQMFNEALNKARSSVAAYNTEAPVRAGQVEQAGNMSYAEALSNALGTGAGQRQNIQTNLEQRGIPLTKDDTGKLRLPDSFIGRPMLPEDIVALTGREAPSNASIQNNLNTNNTKKSIADANRAAVQERQNNLLAWKTQDAIRDQQLKDQISQRSAAVQAGMQPNLGAARLSAFQGNVSPLMQEADRRRQTLSTLPDLLDEAKTPDSTPDKPSVFPNPFTGGQMEMNPGVRLMLASQAKSETERIDELHHAAAHAAGVPELAQPAPAPAAPKPQAQNKPDADHTYDSVPADIRPMVSAIVEGREQGLTGRAAISGRGARIMNAVNQFDPDWSEQRAQIRKSFTTGTDGRNIGALNTAAAHLDQLSDAAGALGNGSFRPGNDIYQKFRTMFGSDAPTNFEGIKAAVSGELATALKGNATDAEIATMKSNIDRSSSPDQLKGIIQENLKILGAKLNTYQERYSEQAPNDKKWSPVKPTAKAIFQKYGINPTAGPAGVQGGAQGGAVQPIPLKDGRTLTPHSQADADRFRKDHPELIK